MKKFIWIGVLMVAVIGLASCDYDDSNDIDVITPNDSTQNLTTEHKI